MAEEIDVWKTRKIDVHVHIGVDKNKNDKFRPTELENQMEKYNIKKTLIFPFNIDLDDCFRKANNMVYRLSSRYEPLEGLARIDPDHEDWRKEMERAFGLELKGFKLNPVSQNFECDQIEHVYEQASKLNLPLLINTSDEDGKYESQLKEILPSYPDITIILTQLKDTKTEMVDLISEKKNLFIESSDFKKQHLEALYFKLDEEKIMFGSDSPYNSIKKALKKMDIDWRSEEDKEKIFFENARRVFDL